MNHNKDIFFKFKENLYNNDAKIKTSFGEKTIVPADTTASGYPYKPIDEWIHDHVYPYYSNTHSNAYNGQLMHTLIENSRNLIKKHVNATKNHQLIFCGSGCTLGINQLIYCMCLKERILKGEKIIIIVSEIEHNANYLPWKYLFPEGQSGNNLNNQVGYRLNNPLEDSGIYKKGGIIVCDMIDKTGKIDINKLEIYLNNARNNNNTIITSLNAGSNVTGVYQDVDVITTLVKLYGGIVCWDYAGSGPYVNIDISKFDAVFLSPHKFLGGPGSSGILIADGSLFLNKIPFTPAGGNTRYVTNEDDKFCDNIETRETGGTPNILGDIRCGLIFMLKQKHISHIIDKNKQINKYIIDKLDTLRSYKNKNMVIINPINSIHRIPIYCIIIKDKFGNNLHYNFAVALLNDLYGIQTRGGVSCCNILAKKLLKISTAKESGICKKIITNKGISCEYGWCRVTFNYLMSFNTINYILDALDYIAINHDKYLSQYKYNCNTNHWVHV
jgi:selenocysteine lyase/cysteine desulfurase